jgi:glycosyltransferase involved in cell wall biosynthesis
MKRLKNIVILFPTFGTGGVKNNLINFVNFCIKKKIKIYLISNIKTEDKKLFKKSYIKFISIKNNFIFNKSNFTLTSILSIFKLFKLLFKLNSKNTVIFSFQNHILPIIFCKIFFQKIIIRNSEDILEATKFSNNKFFAYLILFLKFVFYRFSNGIITNSYKSRKSLKSLFLKNIKLIFNPYLDKIYHLKKINRLNIVLSVGRLCKQKNQSLIIKAFKIFLRKYPNYKLIIIGHGPDYNKLLTLVERLDLSQSVLFVGRKTKIKKYFQSSKILVFPSLYEGLPNVLIDALNYNLPLISSDCSGARDILGNNYKDFVNNDNHFTLARKMITMIINYDQKIKDFSKRRSRLNLFRVKEQSLKYLDYCEKLLI